MIPFVAGGFMYIGAVAVLPTCVNRILFCNSVRLMVDGCRLLEESKSGKQALREVGLITFVVVVFYSLR